MNKISNILKLTSHRPWNLPQGNWVYYQEWNRLLFLHFEVSFEELRKLVPAELELDSFEGKFYISVVPFTMEKIRPRFLPAVGMISNFDEINVRTYVKINDKPGVFFLNIEAGNSLSAFVSRTLSGLPYEKAKINRKGNEYVSTNKAKGFSLDSNYTIGEVVFSKTDLQIWLTERYCLYLYDDNKLYRYEIHHQEWEIRDVAFQKLELNYSIGNIQLTADNTICPNYAEGIKVVSWGKELVEL